MRLFGVQIHTVWSELNTLSSKPRTVFLGSVQLHSREVTANSAEPWAVFRPAGANTDSPGAAIAQALFAKDLPGALGSSEFLYYLLQGD